MKIGHNKDDDSLEEPYLESKDSKALIHILKQGVGFLDSDGHYQELESSGDSKDATINVEFKDGDKIRRAAGGNSGGNFSGPSRESPEA